LLLPLLSLSFVSLGVVQSVQKLCLSLLLQEPLLLAALPQLPAFVGLAVLQQQQKTMLENHNRSFVAIIEA